ncbi:MAG: hypothetical protein ACRYG5_11845 [Janthinobacterium lividum]
MHFIALFFVGALLCNSVPHLVAGLQGKPFPTPFAKPHGVGDSSSLVNFGWGFLNLIVGIGMLLRNPLLPDFNANLIGLLAGSLVIGLYASLHFGKVQRDKMGS